MQLSGNRVRDVNAIGGRAGAGAFLGRQILMILSGRSYFRASTEDAVTARGSSLPTVSVSTPVLRGTPGPAVRFGLGHRRIPDDGQLRSQGVHICPTRAISDGLWLLQHFPGTQLRRHEGINHTHAVEVQLVL
ncbi:MAG: hypothetical protein OXI73_00105 [Rhodospirillales bacterium]|nr:hypothetical protein [Rhodospirillales bacterium]